MKLSRYDSGKRVMSGTWGEVWFEGDLVSEIDRFTAKITYNKTDISRNGEMAVDTKVLSYKGTGSARMQKVNSRMLHLMADKIRDGHDVRITIIAKLADPDAYGSERIRLKNVSFDELTLMDWENNQPGAIEAPFTFTGYDLLDTVDSMYE